MRYCWTAIAIWSAVIMGTCLILGITFSLTGCNPDHKFTCIPYTIHNAKITSKELKRSDLCSRCVGPKNHCVQERYRCYYLYIKYTYTDTNDSCTKFLKFDQLPAAEAKYNSTIVGSHHRVNNEIGDCDTNVYDLYDLWLTGIIFISLAGFSLILMIMAIICVRRRSHVPLIESG